MPKLWCLESVKNNYYWLKSVKINSVQHKSLQWNTALIKVKALYRQLWVEKVPSKNYQI